MVKRHNINKFAFVNANAHIAPCGVNCTLCYAWQRKKNKCGGCLGGDADKPLHCRKCAIAGCGLSGGGFPKYCYECSGKFPCLRLKRLDRQYRQKYCVSLTGNLEKIRDSGLEAFGESEAAKWKCPSCGGLLCVHKPECLHCGGRNPNFPGETKG